MRRRPWRGWDDLAPMQDLLARALRDTPERAFLHPGDLAWWVGWPPQTPDELADRITIVEDEGAIVGWQYLELEEVNQWVDTAAADPEPSGTRSRGRSRRGRSSGARPERTTPTVSLGSARRDSRRWRRG